MADDVKKENQEEYEETRHVRLTITADVANDEEAAKVTKWISEFIDQAKKSFPFKDRVKAVSEHIFSKPKDNWSK